MSKLEEEIIALKELNRKLAEDAQHWKTIAAQRENCNLDLMKEVNELRLKLSKIRSGATSQLHRLDSTLQSSSKEALTHLVQASNAIARSMEQVTAYIRDREELVSSSPQRFNVTSNSEKIHRVPPLLIGGQSIQPVVALSRTLVYNNTSRTEARSQIQQNHNERNVPMHVLQDLHIPLTRIDAVVRNLNTMETDTDTNSLNNTAEDLDLDDNDEQLEESQSMSEMEDTFPRRQLEVVLEEPEDEEEKSTPVPIPRARTDNPLEGPSWLLDVQNSLSNTSRGCNLEPDSTTEMEQGIENSPLLEDTTLHKNTGAGSADVSGHEYTPTMRRRNRPPRTPRTPPTQTRTPQKLLTPKNMCTPPKPPQYSARLVSRRNSLRGRVLKVLVAKMKLKDGCGVNDVTPSKRRMRERSPVTDVLTPKRRQRDRTSNENESPQGSPKSMMRFDAPSPNGSTDACVIVELESVKNEPKESSDQYAGSSTACGSKTFNKRNASHAKGGVPCGDGHAKRRDVRTNGRRIGARTAPRDRGDSAERDSTSAERDSNSGERDSWSAERAIPQRSRRTRKALTALCRESETEQNKTIESMDLSATKANGNRLNPEDDRRLDSGDSDDFRETRDSSSSERLISGRSRRPRKIVIYKEKPLNRKMRR